MQRSILKHATADEAEVNARKREVTREKKTIRVCKHVRHVVSGEQTRQQIPGPQVRKVLFVYGRRDPHPYR